MHGHRRLCLQRVLDAVRYGSRTGYQWRALPTVFPAWTAGHSDSQRGQPAAWGQLNDVLNRADRLATDRIAIQSAYPWVHANHFKGLGRDPDALPDTWEALHRLLQEDGYYLASKAKVEWAENIALHLDPARNTSASFRYFCEGLAVLR